MASIASRATSFRPCVSDGAAAGDGPDAEAIRCYQKPTVSEAVRDLLPTLLKKWTARVTPEICEKLVLPAEPSGAATARRQRGNGAVHGADRTSRADRRWGSEQRLIHQPGRRRAIDGQARSLPAKCCYHDPKAVEVPVACCVRYCRNAAPQ